MIMKSNPDSQVRKILKAAKLYRTECRTAILKALVKASKPLSQDEIARRLSKKRFNKVTIYRALESFCEADLMHKALMHNRINEAYLAEGFRVFDSRMHRWSHDIYLSPKQPLKKTQRLVYVLSEEHLFVDKYFLYVWSVLCACNAFISEKTS